MLSLVSKFQSITIIILFLAAFVLNIAFQNTMLGTLLFLLYLAFFGMLLGKTFAPKENGLLRCWIGTWMLLSSLIVIGSIVYYAFAFTAEVAYTLVLLTPPVVWMTGSIVKRSQWFDRVHDLIALKKHHIPRSFWFSCAIILFTLFVSLTLISSSATKEAVRSVWELIPSSIFIAIFILFFLLVAQFYRGREKVMNLFLIMGALFVFLSVTVLVFPIGYGF